MSLRPFIIIPALALILLMSFPPPAASAEDVGVAKKKYKAIQKEIKSQEEKLKQASLTEQSTLSALDRTNRELNTVRVRLGKQKARLRETKAEIGKARAEAGELEEKLRSHREWMARKLRVMHRYGRYGDVLMLLGAARDAPELLRRWKYLEVLTKQERKAIGEYRGTLELLARKQAELQGLYARQTAEKKDVQRDLKELARRKSEKQKVLATVKHKKAAYEKLLKDLALASKKLREVIMEAERSKRFVSKGFRKLKGKLPWPVQGLVTIPYGTQRDPEFKTPVFRNGIYITSDTGAVAKAVHSGKVVYAKWFKGYGQLVIINHGSGYHTLYANLQEIFLSEGDIIVNRAGIGRVGDSSVLDRPSLYFEIRYKGKPLNPTQWLKKQ